LLIEGLDLAALGVGGELKIGRDAILKVTQIGKEDHPSVVSKTFGFRYFLMKDCFAGH
jgi:MOSC domain-containing protein YiiM